MVNTTRWIDRKTTDLNDAVKLLMDGVEPDERAKTIVWDNWQLDKIFSENCEIALNGRNISYNMIRYSFDQITKEGTQPVEDMTSRKTGFIIVYKTESSLNYIIDQNSSAQRILRRLLSYSGKNEIERNMFELGDDFFIWLINRMYTENRAIETGSGEATQYELKAIRSIKGSADDLQTKVSAFGESVMNLISTLSFLLESDSLNKIQIDLSYTGHENISLVLQSGTVSIETKRYQGKYETENLNERLTKLHLMVYIEVLPILLQEYHSDIENDIWNKERYREFLTGVAKDLQHRIQGKIDMINEEQPEIKG